jgi:formate hydrogenlyase subunit 3/multisubunit Na+/H+ antiporter MnhD subunit
MSGLNFVVPLTPLLLALLLLVPSWQQRVWNLLPWAAAPLLAPLLLDAGVLELPWLFLGTRLGLDATSTPFAWLTVIAWTAAGWFVRRMMADDEHRIRFALFWLVTLCGNLGVFLALDMASFYFSYALMTFAAYGLVLHEGTDEARRAGRIYLILALIGEGLLIAGLVMLAAQFGNADLRELHAGLAAMQNPLLPALLLFTGFAIKAGLVPLHVWLPLAHPIAPVPASAVLSGVIIKAGLIGWLRFIPVGEIDLPEFGNLITGLGLLTAFYAVFVGLAQSRPKTVLAYSSVSQMGLMAALFGLGLVHPGAWPVLFTVLGVFVLHHGLNKTALFLGVRMASDGGSGTRFGLLLAALALTGAPLTSGAVAKTLYKVQIDTIGAPGVLVVVLALSSVATGCLMARLLYLVWPQRRQSAPLSLALCWWLLLALALILPWWWAWRAGPLEPAYALEPASLWASAWPLLVVAALALAAWKLLRRAPRLPEGDLLLVYEALLSPLRRLLTQPADLPRLRLPGQPLRSASVLGRAESLLLRFSSAGLLLLLLGLALALAVMLE